MKTNPPPASIDSTNRTILSFTAVLFLCATTTNAASFLLDPVDAERKRRVPLKVYHRSATEPQPVILFSHGLGGSRENNAYLGDHWAANGYIAVFIQHAGSDEQVWTTAKRGMAMIALKNAAGLKSSLDRFQDVPFVIDHLERWNKQRSHPLFGKLDLEHIGLCGHSFGAVTTLGLGGQKFFGRGRYADDRIDAFLPMSPQTGKGRQAKKSFGEISSPFLCMTGTRDGSPIDPNLSPASRREVYAAMPKGDKYQLVFEGAEHSAFGDNRGLRSRNRNPKHHPTIQKISTLFWNAYLKGDKEAKARLQPTLPTTSLGLDVKDIWEWK
jgi:dienelactone hydrolase